MQWENLECKILCKSFATAREVALKRNYLKIVLNPVTQVVVQHVCKFSLNESCNVVKVRAAVCDCANKLLSFGDNGNANKYVDQFYSCIKQAPPNRRTYPSKFGGYAKMLVSKICTADFCQDQQNHGQDGNPHENGGGKGDHHSSGPQHGGTSQSKEKTGNSRSNEHHWENKSSRILIEHQSTFLFIATSVLEGTYIYYYFWYITNKLSVNYITRSVQKNYFLTLSMSFWTLVRSGKWLYKLYRWIKVAAFFVNCTVY